MVCLKQVRNFNLLLLLVQIVVTEVVRSCGITSCCSDIGWDAQVLLCTATVKANFLQEVFNSIELFLILEIKYCLITNDCLERLGLPKKRANVLISCLGTLNIYTIGVFQIKFFPHFPSNFHFSTSVYVIDKIVDQLSHISFDFSWSGPFSNLKLADSTFYKSSTIDIRLGANIALPLLIVCNFHLVKENLLPFILNLGEWL